MHSAMRRATRPAFLVTPTATATAAAQRRALLHVPVAAALQGGYRAICGVDEAGAGPLAGPVVAAACILRGGAGVFVDGLDDSKKLGPARRRAVYEGVMGAVEKGALAVGVSVVGVGDVDAWNVLVARRVAMARAVEGVMEEGVDLLFVDGREVLADLEGRGIEQWAVIGGDGKISVIAAASVVAKVTRDRLMCELDVLYPVYGFAKHKGYGTPEHLAALKEFGPCPVHRTTFRPVREAIERANAAKELND